MFRTVSLFLVLVFSMALALAPSAAAVDPYKVGFISDITGPASSLGVPERDTAKMLEEEINKKGGIKGPDGQMHPVQVIIYDGQSEETQTVLATKKLIEVDKVPVVICCSQSGTTLAIVKTITDAKVPLVSMAASIRIVEPVKDRYWIFKTPQSDVLVISVLLGHLKAKGIKRLAWLNVNNAFGDSGRVEFEKLAPAAGFEIVAREKFEATDKDMTPQLTKIKGINPDAVVVWAIPPAASIITKNFRQLGFKIPLFQSHGVGNRRYIELAGEDADGVVFPVGKLLVAERLPDTDPQKPVLVSYAKAFEARFGPRNTFGGHAWDALQLSFKALETVGPDQAKIRDYLESVKNFVGISGIFDFSPTEHNGLDRRALTMVEIAKGEWMPADARR